MFFFFFLSGVFPLGCFRPSGTTVVGLRGAIFGANLLVIQIMKQIERFLSGGQSDSVCACEGYYGND